jgi:hypothetical protein
MKPHVRGSSTRFGAASIARPLSVNDEVRLAVVTVAASFAATFAYLWWRHAPLWPDTAAPARQVDAPIVRAPMRGPVSPPPTNPPAPEPVAPQVAAVPDATTTLPSDNLDGPTLPVLVSFATLPGHGGGADNEGGAVDETVRDQLDILNTSDQLLAVTVIDANPNTKKTASTQVLLPPNGQAHINTDSGLPLAAGDQVTLRSSGFRDMGQWAP